MAISTRGTVGWCLLTAVACFSISRLAFANPMSAALEPSPVSGQIVTLSPPNQIDPVVHAVYDFQRGTVSVVQISMSEPYVRVLSATNYDRVTPGASR